MERLKWVIRQICVFYGRSFLATVCLVVGAALLLCLYMAGGARLMSDRELEALLGERYGREFVVVESRKLSQEERAEAAWRAKLFEVEPAGEPGRRFWAFSVVSGGFGGVPGVSNGLLYTYVEDMLLAAFEEQAAGLGLSYRVIYDRYPLGEGAREAAACYGNLRVVIEPVEPANLGLVCQALAGTVAAALEQLPEGYDLAVHMNFMLVYREADWPEGESCTLVFWHTKPVPEGAEALGEYFLAQVDNYKRLFIDKEQE